MLTERTSDDRLIFRYEARAMSRLLSDVALALAALVAFEAITGRRFGDGIGGAIAGSLTAALCALLSYEVSWFEFDARSSTITYRRRWAFRRYRGAVQFADVEAVRCEAAIGKSVPHRRVALRLRDGTSVPLTAGYAPDRGESLTIAEQIRGVLGHTSLSTAADRARALARAGRTIDAVRELRFETDMSFDDAMRQVKELARQSGPNTEGNRVSSIES
jgi:hypothetical protein